MIRYMIEHRLINPMAGELFSKCVEVLEYFNTTIYTDELNELTNNIYEGDHIHSEVLDIFERNIRNTLSNFGITVNEECSLSKALDILQAIIVLEDIDIGLKEDALLALDGEDNIESLNDLLSEYFLVISEDLHYLIGDIEDDFISVIKEFLSTDDVDDHEMEEIYGINKKRKELIEKYSIKDINLAFLREISRLSITDNVIIAKFRDFAGHVDEWAVRVLIAVNFMTASLTDNLERLYIHIPDEYIEQVNGFVHGEYNG